MAKGYYEKEMVTEPPFYLNLHKMAILGKNKQFLTEASPQLIFYISRLPSLLIIYVITIAVPIPY